MAPPDATRHDWRLDHLFVDGPKSWSIHIAVVLLAALAVDSTSPRDVFADRWLTYWTVLQVGLSLGQIALAVSYGRARSAWRPTIFGWLHTSLTAAVAIAWGTGAMLASLGSLEPFFYYTIALGGTALGAVASQNAFLRSCFASLWISLPLLALAHAAHHVGTAGISTAIMVLLYLATLTVLASRINRFLRDRISLTAELQASLDELGGVNAELEVQRRAAEAANVGKSRFLAQASHDLRQPVHAIGLLVGWLMERRLSPDIRGAIRQIETATEVLALQFRSLLDVSALETGRIQPVISAVPLAQVFASIDATNRRAAQAKGVALRIVRTSACVETDPGLLQTMVQNLVTNAIKYASGGKVLVGVRRRPDGLGIVVLDQGPGIPADRLTAVMEDFVRLPQPGTRQPEGLGLGLAIVSRLAALLKLRLVASSRLGRGSAFSLDGLRTTDAPRVATTSRGSRQPAVIDKSVLVVDDDPLVLDAMSRLLRQWGYDVTAMADPPRDIDGHDILLIDRHLQGGHDGLDILVGYGPGSGPPRRRILMSAAIDDELEEQAGSQGIVVLRKPVAPGQLRSAMLSSG
ncbi:MAG: hybrid sensor histidine kinase/response regulator [Enhydrobacter sp.]|nr:MAG: hybrid sensor histidine kinase/response regulator [Enhydrobacter sp.]